MNFERLEELRRAAKEVRDPTAADETVALMVAWANAHRAQKILEIGAGEGLTSCALLLHTEAELTAIELDPIRARRFRENSAMFGLEKRARLLE